LAMDLTEEKVYGWTIGCAMTNPNLPYMSMSRVLMYASKGCSQQSKIGAHTVKSISGTTKVVEEFEETAQ
jgi:hypothetical protein